MTLSDRVMFGLRRALSMPPFTRFDISAAPSPLPGASGVATNRTSLESLSSKTARAYRLYEQFPYTACLYSPREVAFMPVPSPIRYLALYLAPQTPRNGVPSASPDVISIARMRLRSVENDGVRFPGPACSLIAPSSGLYAAPVPALKIAAILMTALLYTYGRPFLPAFISSTPPYSLSSPMISARYLPLSTYFLSGCLAASRRLLHSISRLRRVSREIPTLEAISRSGILFVLRIRQASYTR